jgi:poly(3-hydroxybutyrate) depolymerase
MVRLKSFFVPFAAAALLVLTTGSVAQGSGSALAAPSTGVGTTAATAGCGRTPTLTSGTHTIQSSGQNRTYILRIPDNYDRNHPYRLIFGFHWRDGTAVDVATGQTVLRDVWAYYGLLRLSNNSTIFVAPQGLNNGWANTNGQDVTFVDDMLRQLEADLCVDTTQRFAMGWSFGGAMSFALACARPNVFRAVAVQSGAQLSGCSGGTTPVPYLGIHGIRDSVLNISLGRSIRDRFVQNNGCSPQNPPEPAPGSLTHIITNYSGCRAGFPVEWVAFDEDHNPAPADGVTGIQGARTRVPAEVWRFFTQFQTTPPPPPPPPPTGACRVTDTVDAWNTGLTSNMTITNTGTAAISGWSLVFTLPGGQTITSGWNASYTPTSGQVTARNVSYNADIAAGASVSIGFQATHTGNTAKPGSFTLNGATCAVA